MRPRTVRDLMVPLANYPAVRKDATLLDALETLEASSHAREPQKHPARAVLVVSDGGEVVGKLDQLAVLEALEPKYTLLGDMKKLTQAGVNAEFISSMMENYQFFQGDLEDLCRRCRTLPVRDIMRPVEESIEESASLGEAIHMIVVRQTLSILVRSRGRVVGLLRLSDLFDEISGRMREQASGS